MKKLSILLLVLTFVLCGCGSDKAPSENIAAEQAANEPMYYIESPEYGYLVYEDYVELKEFFGSATETVEIPAMFYDAEAKVEKPLKIIGHNAFNSDSGARYLTIPDTVTEIRSSAFRECQGIETVTLGKNVKTIGNSAFAECTSIREIVIPDSVEYIGDFAFHKCATATSVALGSGVTEIGESAFNGCLSVETVSGGESLKLVNSDAFGNTPWLNGLSEEFSGIGSVLLKYNGSATEVEIPQSFKSVSNAFEGMQITRISFPEGFETIGNNAFADCTALSDVAIPKTVSAIGNDAFENTPYFESLTSEDGFCVVGDGVLIKYEGTASGLMIPDTVKYISNAFDGNEYISEVRIGNNVETIGRDAFESCPKLTMVIMSEAVKHIDEYAFYGSDILEFNASGNKYAAKWAKDYGLSNIIN